MKQILMFQHSDGSVPFDKWICRQPSSLQGRIFAYINRVAIGGSKKNVKSICDGIFEIKINIGPGYRVYFGEKENTIILLLLGGDKSTQKKDIKKAIEYWRIENATK